LDILSVRDVQSTEFSAAGGGVDIASNPFKSVSTTGAEHYFRALASQQSRGSLTDTAACAGDCDDFVFDVQHDWFPLLFAQEAGLETRLRTGNNFPLVEYSVTFAYFCGTPLH
jgi:hypothetical protein